MIRRSAAVLAIAVLLVGCWDEAPVSRHDEARLDAALLRESDLSGDWSELVGICIDECGEDDTPTVVATCDARAHAGRSMRNATGSTVASHAWLLERDEIVTCLGALRERYAQRSPTPEPSLAEGAFRYSTLQPRHNEQLWYQRDDVIVLISVSAVGGDAIDPVTLAGHSRLRLAEATGAGD